MGQVRRRGYLLVIIVVAALVTSAVPGPLSAPASAQSVMGDGFDSETLAPQWTWTRPPNEWAVSGSHLHIQTERKDIWQYHNDAPLLLQGAPTGNFDVVTKLTMAPCHDFQQAGLVIYDTDDNYVRLTFGSWYGNQFLEFGKEIRGRFTSLWGSYQEGVDRSRCLASPSTVLLRIGRSGQAYTAYFSRDDGETWTLVGRHEDVPIAAKSVGLTAFHSPCGNCTQTTTASFDYFAVVMPPERRAARGLLPAITGKVLDVDLAIGDLLDALQLRIDANHKKIIEATLDTEDARPEGQ